MRDLSRPLFPIGVVAGLIGCSPSTLRSWEAKGLVSPIVIVILGSGSTRGGISSGYNSSATLSPSGRSLCGK